jgi:cytochrome c biogenesis protein CcdA/thiol-disulfide isomerase/thioredoxin
MILFLLAYVGGVLTIVSPCILPVLPFVFARADRPFARSGLPMLAGMAATFAAVAALAAVGGGWAVRANQYGRVVAMLFLAVLGVTLLVPDIADRLTTPLVALGARFAQRADQSDRAGDSSVLSSLVLGVATGLLWAPCAGPVLGLILTGAALQGASAKTSLLLLAYAAGAATSLALALIVGGRVFTAMKRSLGASEWIRRGLGVAVLAGVLAIALGADTGVLTRLSLASTASLEQGLVGKIHADGTTGATPSSGATPAGLTEDLPVEGTMPSLVGATAWLNSPPLTTAGLRGKVVLVDFWTYSCVNCLRAIPYVEAWAEKYRAQGLVVIGVHSPEFAFEKSVDNVRDAIAGLKISYPVAIDNGYAIWRAFGNEYWPAHYFIDAQGRIRNHHFGEGAYDEGERTIQQLLAEAGTRNVTGGLVAVNAAGVEAAADMGDVQSEETYIGYDRAEHFASPGGAVKDAQHAYSTGKPQLNEWALRGDWTVVAEHAELNTRGGSIVYRFHARDLHLVLGPAPDGRPVRFRVTIDGVAPGENHGADIDASGAGVVTAQQLYQLIRQQGAISDHTFEIRFLDAGAWAYAFTFG